MKKLALTLMTITALFFASCDSEDDSLVPIGGNVPPVDEDLTGIISQNLTLTKNVVWELNGKVVVASGVTLTIEPGTIIKGKEGQGSLASALIVARGGKIDARGTAQEPIIFTSVNDNITVGQKAGTNLTENDRGLWGGVLILGSAPISVEGDAPEAQIEGIPADESFGRYGGANAADNSGVFQYVSIRHGGALIGSGNEINGLTLGGVGNGTTINNVEIVANLDDGFEFFGGTVNASNVLSFAGADDALDVDQAYSGTITNAVVIQGNESDHALEIDGPEGTFLGSFTIDKLTIIGNPAAPQGELGDFRDGARGTVKNVFARNFSATQDVELKDSKTAANYTAGDLKFMNWQVVLPQGIANVSDIFIDKTSSTNFKSDSSNFTTAVQAGSQTTGADLSVFGWTFAKARGAF